MGADLKNFCVDLSLIKAEIRTSFIEVYKQREKKLLKSIPMLESASIAVLFL